MIDNPCLKPASLEDVKSLCDAYCAISPTHKFEHDHFICVLRELYEAEARLRAQRWR